MYKISMSLYLTNRLYIFMVYTSMDQKNDVIKCSKFTWANLFQQDAGKVNLFHCQN